MDGDAEQGSGEESEEGYHGAYERRTRWMNAEKQTTTMACCNVREDEDRDALRRRETSSSRKRESAKTAGEESSDRLETTKISRG